MQGKTPSATGNPNSFIMENIRAAAAVSRGKPGKIGVYSRRPCMERNPRQPCLIAFFSGKNRQ
jgi:hypothetical protein